MRFLSIRAARGAVVLLSIAAAAAGVAACGGDDASAPPTVDGGAAAAPHDGGTDATTLPDARGDDAGDASHPADGGDASDAGDGSDLGDAADAGDGSADADDASDADAGDAAPFDGGPTVVVVRVGGDGDAGVSASRANAVFLEERYVATGDVVRTVALPTKASGANQPITLSGGFAEAGLARSTDGRYLTLAGYAIAPGPQAGWQARSAPLDAGAPYVPRVVARVDANGAVDTSTLLVGPFNSEFVRAAVTADGSGYWVAGSGGHPTTLDPVRSGIQYVVHGSTGASTDVSVIAPGDDLDFRYDLAIVGGQLFSSGERADGTGGFVSTFGAGLPVAAAADDPLFTTDPASSVFTAFVPFDTDAVAGPDLIYAANLIEPSGGVQKWKLAAGKWSMVQNIPANATVPAIRGLTGWIEGGVATLVATSDGSENVLLTVTDDGATPSPSLEVIANAPAGSVFGGVALPPTR